MSKRPESPQDLTRAQIAYLRVWAASGPRPSLAQRIALRRLADRLGVTP